MNIENEEVLELWVSGTFYLPIEDLGITNEDFNDFPNNLTATQKSDLVARIGEPYLYFREDCSEWESKEVNVNIRCMELERKMVMK